MTTDWLTAAREQADREARDYAKAKGMLPPAIRAEWEQVEANMEHFDGEWGLALGYLLRWLRDRRHA